MTPRHPPHLVEPLSAQLSELAPLEGVNTGALPRLTTYRFSGPASWMRAQVQPLSLVIVAQGRHRLRINGMTRDQGPLQCLVLGGHVFVDGEVFEASIRRPYLCFVLEIEPEVVRRVASDITDWSESKSPVTNGSPRRAERARTHELLELVVWSETSIRSDLDRHLLAPMHQKEIVYRLLQSEQGQLLRALAIAESAGSQVSTVIEYARTHLAEPLSVPDMADLVSLSTSAFAHQFRAATGRPPHQFLKEMRLDHARELLADSDLTVTRISKEVGYASVSQFISAFRGRFGVTPARVQRNSR